MTTTQAPRDVISILTTDHREVEAMFAELERLKGSADSNDRQRRADLAEQVVIELVRHSVAEEAEVYPRIKERIDAGEADELVREQAESEQTMKALEKLEPGQPEFEQQLSHLRQQISAHVAEEEEQALPRLRSTFTTEELVEMGNRVESVKRKAPTRPHPAAPDEPPGNKALGPMAGLIDRMRDALSGRGTG
jgi:hemerythrin-like domain-containing protein